ncbi:hypothetical protein A3B21_01910 [Candidatus Uhrbacteria bacterium RIFCSPLOWO2_01_FULL_47_24]|uniref:Uncharacterized protein n=1 Tax=Candidatus Uhrbacteria bacterium RIFCSPLOWO2_01_FULL_47_24 TaxID=1802401 RepID=A0A1F7UP84_9BACT|nr:MAG: hypothetical protein A2753_01660 [Candidatus Uhrbacteria bacterium RIFCSPHIGHO2_01_FULL_47_11]OGL67924.1 MAG: hypothetical protein A3D58_05105 [Candidatus Uhrbacteria bacterium RIFCSPHIGHO2_02_FULL_46_47]OGL75195.1 MAG: hypothetical protein A3F52_04095 [Candidatus Uhrbacteria bacterium RIFCSPHIGHO2_12_FULL_47_11]OGL80110.1 MAG: hypothetical protein A3B21_01910 [Candidatus Uhrbacteria bacterium RIFCSPLOWO2_01_FULL_47_24]OGL84896.1 MAG: hypothetical protein A3J03_04295 [Candidatus Uhrbact
MSANINGEPTNAEILEAMNEFATKVDQQFVKINATLTTIPTQDDMDKKLFNTKGDIILTVRKEDVKLRTLVEILREKKVLTDPDIKRILSLEPFPQLFL